jgi:hypothetical protein
MTSYPDDPPGEPEVVRRFLGRLLSALLSTRAEVHPAVATLTSRLAGAVLATPPVADEVVRALLAHLLDVLARTDPLEVEVVLPTWEGYAGAASIQQPASGGGGGGGTVTNVSSTDVTNLSVATPTTTPKLTVHNAPSATTAKTATSATHATTATTATSAKTATKADGVRTVAVSATAPTAGQVLTATSGTAADWATVATATSAKTATKADALRTVVAAVTAPTAGQVLTATTATAAHWATPAAGTVTDVTSPDGSVTVTTPTTTPKLEVVLSKKKTQQSTTPVGGQVLTYTATAGLWVPAVVAKIRTTTVLGNPAAAGELLVSTAADEAHWTATPPGAKKLHTTVITGNATAAGQVLTATAADAADWAAISGLPITAETSVTGVALINGTQTILAVTVPADGKVHMFLWQFAKHITAALTGGKIATFATNMAGTSQTWSTTATVVGWTEWGNVMNAYVAGTIAGTQVAIKQTTAMTAGAATVRAKIIVF